MKQSEIARYAGSIVGLGDDFCTVRLKEFDFDSEFDLPKTHFECKIVYGQPFYAIITKDSEGKHTLKCVERIIELTPERKRFIQKVEKLLKDI